MYSSFSRISQFPRMPTLFSHFHENLQSFKNNFTVGLELNNIFEGTYRKNSCFHSYEWPDQKLLEAGLSLALAGLKT